VLDPAHYGALPAYKGINFLPQQALLHSPAGGALAEQTFSLSDQSPVVELGFVSAMLGAIDVPQGTPVAQMQFPIPTRGDAARIANGLGQPPTAK